VVAGDEGPRRVRLDVTCLDQEAQGLPRAKQGAQGPQFDSDVSDLALGHPDLTLVRMDRLAGNWRTPGISVAIQFPVRDPLPPVGGLTVALEREIGKVDDRTEALSFWSAANRSPSSAPFSEIHSFAMAYPVISVSSVNVRSIPRYLNPSGAFAGTRMSAL
jgi:hypothetical protein